MPVLNTNILVADTVSRPENSAVMDEEDWSIEATPTNARRSDTANAKRLDFGNARTSNLIHEDDVVRQIDNVEEE